MLLYPRYHSHCCKTAALYDQPPGESRLHDNGQVPSAPTCQRGCSGASIQRLPYRLAPSGGSLKWAQLCFFPFTAFAMVLF